MKSADSGSNSATVSPAIGPAVYVVAGVSGCGKSTVGRLLAARLGLPFLEGDEFHPPQNVERMAAGIALTDADRAGWLRSLSERLAAAVASGSGAVLACSALKRSYRDVLRRGAPALRLLHLDGSRELLAQRLGSRSGHYMPASLLDSQLATLEPPTPGEQALQFDIAQGAEAIVAGILAAAPMAVFTKVILVTDDSGRARFREETLAYSEGAPQALLTPLAAAGGWQLRHSPVGFRSSFHCTTTPQWVFILGGRMEIGLQDGSSRVFSPGDHFFSADTLPAGAAFDAAVHGHWSRQLGDEPLVTLFLRA